MDLKPIYFLDYLSSFISDFTSNLCTFRLQIFIYAHVNSQGGSERGSIAVACW